MLSVKAGSGVHEVWIFAGGGYREYVSELGLCGSEGEGERLAALLKFWLRFNVFGTALTEAIPCREDRASLRGLPDFLRERGIDPAAVRVACVRRGHESDNDIREPDDEEDEDDTTTLDPHEFVRYTID
jgi:hypothetical protein